MNIYHFGGRIFAIFSGLGGVSTLIYSLTQNSTVPTQNKHHNFKINKNVLRGIFAGGIAGSILGFLPGMGLLKAAFWHKNSVVAGILEKIGRDF